METRPNYQEMEHILFLCVGKLFMHKSAKHVYGTINIAIINIVSDVHNHLNRTVIFTFLVTVRVGQTVCVDRVLLLPRSLW